MKLARFEKLPIIGIARGATLAELLPAVEAAVSAGLCTLEVTMNRPEALAQIKRLRRDYGRDLELGAGTVLTAKAAEAAIAAGAEFLVTPAVLPEVVKAAKRKRVPVFLGAMTPTEILAAERAGAAMVKVFPASVLGPEFIRAVRGPFPDIRLLPTGGVTVESVPEYFRAGAKGVGIGGEIFKKEWMQAGDVKKIAEAARSFIEAVEQSARFL